MRKIFFLLPNLSAGGAERVTITIARIMKRNGADVEFINLGSPEGEMKNWIVPEFKLNSLNYSRTLAAIPALLKIMRKNQSAVFFSSREHTNLANLLSSKICKTKSIIRIPNLPFNVLGKGLARLKMGIVKGINKSLMNNAGKIISQTEEMKVQIINYYGIAGEHVHVISNPVDKEYIIEQGEETVSPFNSSEINFLNVCNIAYSKGIDTLIEAWPIVKEAIPNSHMYILGRNSSTYALSLMEKAQNLPDFTFLGFQSNPYPYIKNCDVFVLPSRMEGFPNVVLEAMCFNKRIAATNCVQVIEKLIVPGKNGFYCSIDNPKELASCMIRTSQIDEYESNYGLFEEQELINIFNDQTIW